MLAIASIGAKGTYPHAILHLQGKQQWQQQQRLQQPLRLLNLQLFEGMVLVKLAGKVFNAQVRVELASEDVAG